MSTQYIPDAIRSFIKDKLFMSSDNDFAQEEVLNDGLSGAKVYRINIRSRRERCSGYYIIKCIDTTSRWYDEDRNEKARYEILHTNSQQFGDRLVKVFSYGRAEEFFVIIYSQAVSSVVHAVPLEKLAGKNLIAFIKQLSNDY